MEVTALQVTALQVTALEVTALEVRGPCDGGSGAVIGCYYFRVAQAQEVKPAAESWFKEQAYCGHAI